MNLLKKLNISSCISLLSFVVGFVGFILYFVTYNTNGYFYQQSVGTTLTFTIIALVVLLATIAIRFVDFKVEGVVKSVIDTVSSLLSACASIFFALAAMFFISPKVEGIAFIYFSNADVLETIQTPANLASSKLAIATCIILLVAAVIQVVACFFSFKKEVSQESTAEVAA